MGEQNDDGLRLEKSHPLARVAEVLASALDETLLPALYLVATPIGNLGDISLRAISVLSRASIIAAEDTRHSGKLLAHFGIRAELISYHDHNGEIRGPKIVSMIKAGKSVALISDAGTPLISDPGFKLARLARRAGLNVQVIPGPSAVLAGLSLAGLPTDRFFFEGFLPSKASQRCKRIERLKDIDASLVLFESVKRISLVVDDLAAILGPREGVILRELTKLHEEVIRGPLDKLAQQIKGRDLKGELVVVIGPPVLTDISDAEIEAALKVQFASENSLRDSVRAVMGEFGLSRRRVYELALKLEGEG